MQVFWPLEKSGKFSQREQGFSRDLEDVQWPRDSVLVAEVGLGTIVSSKWRSLYETQKQENHKYQSLKSRRLCKLWQRLVFIACSPLYHFSRVSSAKRASHRETGKFWPVYGH
jgi:hypothetical protein